MKPVSLRFQCFGPYMEEQYIDFSRLEPSGLFLICGETGAGKTTILDAICCALYGKASGELRGKGGLEAMRCKLAGKGDETKVDFIFTSGPKRFRFTRSLKYARKNLNDFHNCMVFENGNYVPLLENPVMTEVNRQAVRLIGLTYDQFRQVMILPQGQFEKLLVSDSEEKEKILVSLFHAERWQRITDELARRVGARDSALKQELLLIRAKLAEYDVQDPETLSAAAEAAGRTAAAAEAAWQNATAEVKRCQQACDRASLEDREFAELHRRRQALDKLLDQQQEAGHEERKLNLARRAEAIRPLYEAWHERHLREQEAAALVQDKEKAAAAAQSRLKTVKQEKLAHDSQRAAHDNKIERLAQCRSAVQWYRTLEQHRQEARNADLALTEANQALLAAQIDREAWDSLHQSAQQSWEQASAALQQTQEESPLVRLREARPLYRLLQEQQQAAAQTEAALQQTETAAQEAHHQYEQADLRWQQAIALQQSAIFEYQDAQRRYLQGIGGILAQELRQGQPCPVCGSREHPHPAQTDQTQITEEALRALNQNTIRTGQDVQAASDIRTAAEKNRNDLQSTLERQRQAAAAAAAACKTLQQQKIPEIASETELKKAITTEEDRLERCRQAVHSAAGALEDAAQNRAAAEIRRQEAQLHKEQCGNAAAAANAAWKSAEARRLPGIETQQRLEDEITALQKQTDGYKQAETRLSEQLLEAAGGVRSADTALQEARAAHRQTQERLVEQAAAWTRALADSGLDSESQFLSARMEPSELEQRKAALTAFHTRLSEAKQAWQIQSERLSGRNAPALEPLRQALEKAESLEAAAAKTHTLQQAAFARMSKDACALSRRQAAHDAARRAVDTDLAFADALRGRTGVSLQRYVLGVMLTAITAEANRMLQHVHGGRYRLYRTDESAGSSRKRGLELEVLDGQSNERRSVTTLSGGEKFLVSLSLAIGLSTVVQAQGSGIRLEAMFIDEGFGSLDNSSISDAFEILQGIQRSHGLIGIISHVERLEETIQNKIEVIKDRRGSHCVLSC